VYNKTIAPYLKTQVLFYAQDFEQCISQMRFVSNNSFHRFIKMIPFEVSFGLEPPTTAQNPNPDLKKQ
jgi:hypothetical protein